MIHLYFFLIGTVFASFLGLVIDRFPERSIITPASHCNACGKRLAPRDLIPIFSQVMNRLRCRFCGDKIPLRYLFFEFYIRQSFSGNFAWYDFHQSTSTAHYGLDPSHLRSKRAAIPLDGLAVFSAFADDDNKCQSSHVLLFNPRTSSLLLQSPYRSWRLSLSGVLLSYFQSNRNSPSYPNR